ncbi:hypothetical protein TNCV_195951 [Trichonephila clavipes]|uniref:Uncharacterized protein n=1 Tax=Trichonephila clavipes TaxID=2585209 RepID=A0A8X7BM72_TRICX|nr:hypothetical protein TNCV_195951 [Trichonephila clavipes]
MSLDTERETHHFIEVSTKLMANAKLELRGWEFIDSNVSTPQPEISKVLGMLWNRKNDTLSCEERKRWRHVPTSENPADLPLRGCSAKKLIESRWWEGPQWLMLSEKE